MSRPDMGCYTPINSRFLPNLQGKWIITACIYIGFRVFTTSGATLWEWLVRDVAQIITVGHQAPDGDCFKFCTTEMLFAKIMITIDGETDLFKDKLLYNILREGRQLIYVLVPLCCFNGLTNDKNLTMYHPSLIKDLNCGRGRIAFIAVADTTDAIAVIAGIAV
ncbi:hypothetical protein Gotri_021546, partial [Gossypium trilobum]|nr:hypothetical protein [Gossypium trilobum]